jgi:hypothetical protein
MSPQEAKNLIVAACTAVSNSGNVSLFGAEYRRIVGLIVEEKMKVEGPYISNYCMSLAESHIDSIENHFAGNGDASYMLNENSSGSLWRTWLENGLGYEIENWEDLLEN